MTVEPFAVPFWALGTVCAVLASCHQHLTLPAGPALLHRRTQSMSLYGHAACTVVASWLNSQRRRVGPPSPVSYLGMLFIYGQDTTNLCRKRPEQYPFPRYGIKKEKDSDPGSDQ